MAEHYGSAHLHGSGELEVSGELRRGVNSNRLTLLAVLVGVALTVAFGVQGVSWLWRVGIGAATFLGLAVLIHVALNHERSTHWVMAFAHWVLGRKG